jgi:hypothetical protein
VFEMAVLIQKFLNAQGECPAEIHKKLNESAKCDEVVP